MKNSGKSQNSMRAVTINCDFSLPGLSMCNSNYYCCTGSERSHVSL